MKQNYNLNPTPALPTVGKKTSRWLAYSLSLWIVFSFAMSAKAQWTQMGSTINGTANSQQFGNSHALSSDGSIWAIGASAGNLARVYTWNGSTWTQRGADLVGEAAGDGFGFSVALSSDGLTLAVAANNNDGAASNAGHVRVFTWNGSAWVQKGADVDGPVQANAGLGESVAISADGNTFIVGAPYYDGGASDNGLTRVYSWNGSAWVQKGADFVGTVAGNTQEGRTVSISSDGNTIATGATGESSFGGVTRVYTWNGSAWAIKGSAFTGSGGDNSAWAVRLTPDGNTLAISTPYNGSTDIGFIRVYTWNGSAWVQKGADITGTANGDNEGRGLAISSDGNTIATGCTLLSTAGRLRIFEYSGGAWAQKGSTISAASGDVLFATFTSAVALSADGSRVASGSGPAAGGGTQRGTARAFAFIIPQEINVKGNTVSIVSGDVTPDAADHTSFGFVNIGGNLARTYTIENTGGTVLNITSVTSNNAKFVVSGAPATVAASTSATFTVTYTPTVSGTDNATITIVNNDSNEGTYTFAVQGNLNNALNFDDTNDYVSIPDNASLNFGAATDYTLEAWINYTVSQGNYTGILAKGTGGGWTGYQFVLVNNRIFIETRSNLGNIVGVSGTTTLNDGVWHHVAVVCTRSSNNMKIYVDGVLEANVTDANISQNIDSSSPLYIASERALGGSYFGGNIDEVRIWNTARTCDQINAVKNRELVGTESNLVAYYNFNQGVASGTNTGLTSLPDLATTIGGANNGTLTNFATLTGATSNWVDGSGNNVFDTTPTAQPEINLTVGTSGSTKDLGGYNIGTNNDFTYAVQNLGGASLSLTGTPRIVVSGATNATFTVTTQPSATVIAGGSSNFTIRITPTGAVGSTFSALFTVANTDCDEGSYTFTLTGKVVNATPSAVRGNMMLFASSQNITIPHQTAFNVSAGNFTLESWVRYTTSGNNTIISKGNGSGIASAESFIFQLQGDRLALYLGYTATGGEWKVAPTTLPINTWNHVAVSYVSSTRTATFYVNGVAEVGTFTYTTDLYTSSTSNVFIGQQGFGCACNPFRGNIDELKIWNTARTQAQIRDNMHLTLSGSESGLLAYYQFNEASGNAIDVVNSANNGTLNGASRTASTVSVAKGVSSRINVITAGVKDFTGTNCSLNFAGTLPAGDVVVNRLEGAPSGTQLATNTVYNTYFWVINNYGTNAGLTVTPTFVLGANQITSGDASAPSNIRLHKRVTNNGGSWTQFVGTSANASTGSATFNNIDSFSEFGVGSAGTSPLPITLLGFAGERVNGGTGEMTEEVRLNWSTASEINNKSFEVEISADGRNYEKIAFVDGKGNSTTVMSYELRIHNADDAYYRLKQVDFDGKFSYSPVVFVEGVVGKVVVYPNPNNGKFTISVGKDKLDSPARLLNAVGKEVWRGVQTEVRTTGLPTGIYFLHTTVAGKTKITKVIIER